jgi:TetR/AcrR family transcriptional regulator, mexCD-oprJ operon repressor
MPASPTSPAAPELAESPSTATSPPARASSTRCWPTPSAGLAVAVDNGPAPEALSRLIHSSWRIVDHHRSLLAAAQRDLPPGRIRHHHDQAMARVERLVARGQRAGDFRTDLPRPWLVATFYSVLHGAAEEVDAGRLDPAKAPETLTATLLAAFTAQATRPRPG